MKKKIIYWLPAFPVIGFIYIALLAKKYLKIPINPTLIDDLEVGGTKANIFAFYQAICIIIPLCIFIYFIFLK